MPVTTRICPLLLALIALDPAVAAAQSPTFAGAQAVYQPPIDVIGEVQHAPRNPLLMPRLRIGVAGVVAPFGPQVSGRGSHRDANAITFALGPTVAFLWPLHENFAVGARGVLGFSLHDHSDYHVDGEGDQRAWDLAPVLELRIPMNVVATLRLGAFVGASINEWIISGNDRSTGRGWHGGGSVGWDFMVGHHVGFFFEASLLFRRVWHHPTGGTRNVDTYENSIAFGVIVGI